MVKVYKNVIRCICLFICCNLMIQETGAASPVVWNASWIAVPDAGVQDYGVYYFRKTITLQQQPDSFSVYVSADNSYKLFVNGRLVALGPDRGDVMHWSYDEADLAPYLRQGQNVVAAVVWNEGVFRQDANISYRTGFILQGAAKASEVLNTDASWKCKKDAAYSPVPVVMPNCYVAGPGERVDMRKHLSGWNSATYDDGSWADALPLMKGTPRNRVERPIDVGLLRGWQLVPSTLPPMELKKQRLQCVKSSTGCSIPQDFPLVKRPVTVPPRTKAALILDQESVTNAYFTLVFSRGKDSRIAVSYQEALFTEYPFKGNRNDIKGKRFIGRQDSLVSNGSEHQEFTTLSWRTYRYIQLEIETQDEPLVIDDVYGTFIGFPFRLEASLDTDDAEIEQLFSIGWRTARLCAVDTYMDCPYYERLQYIGDARIQALISYYNAGDARLARHFLGQIETSILPEGITMSRYPAITGQVIPPFSLWYIGALHDYMMYVDDLDFIRGKLVSVRRILDFFAGYQQADGSVCGLPGWIFTDWVDNCPGWDIGVAEAGQDGCSALVDLQLLYALQMAEDMERRLGLDEQAKVYARRALRLKTTIRRKYWSGEQGLFANRMEKDRFSQHANILAILTGTVEASDMESVACQLTANGDLAPASVYFKYYLHQALTKAGKGNDYIGWLDIWRKNLAMGLTTWAETSDLENSRSDCHAWGASPNIEFFRTILGIDSDAPAFQRIKIEPHLGSIDRIGGRMPHPNGTIKVAYERVENSQLKVTVTLPQGISGRFVWQKKEYPLHEEENYLSVPDVCR